MTRTDGQSREDHAFLRGGRAGGTIYNATSRQWSASVKSYLRIAGEDVLAGSCIGSCSISIHNLRQIGLWPEKTFRPKALGTALDAINISGPRPSFGNAYAFSYPTLGH